MLRKTLFVALCLLAALSCKKESRGGDWDDVAVTGEVTNLTSTSATLNAYFHPLYYMGDNYMDIRCATDKDDLRPYSSTSVSPYQRDTDDKKGECHFHYNNLKPGTTYYYQACLAYDSSFGERYAHGQVKQFTTPVQ